MDEKKGLNTEFGVDRGGDRGNPPVPGGNVSSDTFRVPEGSLPGAPAPRGQAQEETGGSRASTGSAGDAHTDSSDLHSSHLPVTQGGQGYNAPASAPTPESSAAADEGEGSPDRAASGQEQGKCHDL